MKRTLTLLGLSLMLLAAPLFAQNPMDQASEKAVQITAGPSITNISGTTATINWTTNSAAANHVRYRVAGSNSGWKSAYHPGGGTSHSLQLTGLEPGKTYEWQILTRDGDVRTAGQFQSAATATGTAPDVNVSNPAVGTPAQGAGDQSYGQKVAIYRGVNNQGAHLYSANAGDVTAGGFKSEGTVGNLMASQVGGTTALYRLASPSGDSFLTRDSNERTAAIGQGLQDQGIVGYIATSQQPGTIPLYRLVNPGAGQHFYTVSESERQEAIRRGLKDEGVVGFVWQ
ncbi:MAG: fibronectin type III domain-containing protein [Acidobacteriia bacterium]|nr:fibronectin type III domain-containing protein [Terriglobia bacterium]